MFLFHIDVIFKISHGMEIGENNFFHPFTFYCPLGLSGNWNVCIKGLLYYHGSILIQTWISKYIYLEVWCNRWNLRMDTSFHPTINAVEVSWYMLGLKLFDVSVKGPRSSCKFKKIFAGLWYISNNLICNFRKTKSCFLKVVHITMS